MQESNKMLLGKILSTIGAISEQDVHRMLRLKAEESIYDVFSWPEGDFRFLDHQLPTANMVPISIDVTGLVLEGMQRFDEWKRIRGIVPSANSVPVAVGEFDEKVLTEGAPQILSLIDDDRTVADICKLTHSSEFHVCRILFRQVQSKRLKIVRPRGEAAPEPAEAVAPPTVPPVISPEALVLIAQQSMQKNEFETALRHMRAARALDPDSRKLAAEAEKIEEQIRAAVETLGRPADLDPGARPHDGRAHPAQDLAPGGVPPHPPERRLRPEVDRQHQLDESARRPARGLEAPQGRPHPARDAVAANGTVGRGEETARLPLTA